MQHDIPASIEITPPIRYVGTPVALVSTCDARGRSNLSPMSSVWALGDRLMLGMAEASQGCANLLQVRAAVINFPGPGQCAAVEGLAPTTGRHPAPTHKQAMGYRHEPDKFGLAGLTPIASRFVSPPHMAECPLQMEVRLLAATRGQRGGG